MGAFLCEIPIFAWVLAYEHDVVVVIKMGDYIHGELNVLLSSLCPVVHTL